MFQIIQSQQERDAIENTAERHKIRMKEIFDKKLKKICLQWVTLFSGRMHERKKKVSMGSSIIYG